MPPIYPGHLERRYRLPCALLDDLGFLEWARRPLTSKEFQEREEGWARQGMPSTQTYEEYRARFRPHVPRNTMGYYFSVPLRTSATVFVVSDGCMGFGIRVPESMRAAGAIREVRQILAHCLRDGGRDGPFRQVNYAKTNPHFMPPIPEEPLPYTLLPDYMLVHDLENEIARVWPLARGGELIPGFGLNI